MLQDDPIVEKRRALARAALEDAKDKSTDWAYGVPAKGWKCNIFCGDKMRALGMYPKEEGYISAGTWGDENTEIAGWQILKNEPPQAGDIGAYSRSSGTTTGHMGIMNSSTKIIYAGSDYVKTATIQGFNQEAANRGYTITWVYRRFVGFNK
ncbi:hypothetical protein GO730_02700 [Spirosoma sp. HMF3257]|uniref:CHAP domain-containing protein n=1 Tax=Spirosoma telluris TaxID=2183553 RepID=A0A327NEP1_9BACT|nr:hypothetical protein [Spirosoma telluris]RAI73597.1 hypothetical protein HMF3257_02640 [Spirosoma telluris]